MSTYFKYLLIAIFLNAWQCILISNNAEAAQHSDLKTIAGLIHRHHIDHPPSVEIPTDLLGSLEYYLTTLDPYSSYLNAEEFARATDMIHAGQPSLGGAVTQTAAEGLILVPFENGPAYQAGIRQPVRLIRVEGQETAGMALKDLARMVATHARLAILAESLIDARRLRATVSIQPFQVPSVEIIEEEGQQIIRLHVFPGKQAFYRLRQYLKQITDSGKPVIIDLRYAIGGNLFEALDSISLILPWRLPIATTIGSDGLAVSYKSRNDLRVTHGPVYLLIGPQTASAAEVFARALHDHGHAILIGRPTQGKCVTQQFFKLPLQDGLKLTVGRILDSEQRFCNGRGIDPDLLFLDTQNIYDTKALLKAVEAHRRQYRFVCFDKFYQDPQSLEKAQIIFRNNSESTLKPISLIMARNDQRLCLGPPMTISSAEAVKNSESRRLKEAMSLSVFPRLNMDR